MNECGMSNVECRANRITRTKCVPRSTASLIRHSMLDTRHSRARGFSFTELLFAVMIMGIGFIMIAAIFPVGLAQSKSNLDETQASTIARAAVAAVESNAKDADFPDNAAATPLQASTNATLVRSVHSNMISPSDPRYAWTALYRREPTTDFAQLILFVVNRSEPFTSKDFVASNGVRRLEPRPIQVSVSNGEITISNDGFTDGNQSNASAALPGAFIVIGDDRLAGDAGMAISEDGTATAVVAGSVEGRMNGRVYRLGNQISANRFEFMPGYEFGETFIDVNHDNNTATPPQDVKVVGLNDARAYIIGRDRPGTGGTASDFEGGVMDVAYYTTFISLK